MSGTELFATFLGSVALLLWGVRMVRTGMTRAFGATLRNVVATSTRTWPRAFLAGVGVTGLLQSSAATAVLLASFAARGLIVLPMALVMMLGANIGTTLTAQVFAFDVTWLWTAGIGAGVLLFTLSEGDQAKAIGRIGIGFGLMLLSLIHLKSAAALLRWMSESSISPKPIPMRPIALAWSPSESVNSSTPAPMPAVQSHVTSNANTCAVRVVPILAPSIITSAIGNT